jgi:hypothetical protein
MDDPTALPPLPRPKRRIGRRTLVAAAVAATVVTVGGAVAFAAAGGDGDDRPTNTAAAERGHDHDEMAAGHDHDDGTAAGAADMAADTAAGDDSPAAGADAGGPGRRHRHEHPPLTPYAERYAAATPEQQAAADDLRAAVAATVAPYADVDAAVAAGYRVVPATANTIAHYVDPAATRDGRVLDPSRPEGLVYYAAGEGDPVLLGAFFIARPGEPLPDDAGGIVVWHSHDPACTGFFATPDQPCTDSRRMLHVWTADHLDITARRTGQTVGVDFVDPFGAPFRAAIARSDPAD